MAWADVLGAIRTRFKSRVSICVVSSSAITAEDDRVKGMSGAIGDLGIETNCVVEWALLGRAMKGMSRSSTSVLNSVPYFSHQSHVVDISCLRMGPVSFP